MKRIGNPLKGTRLKKNGTLGRVKFSRSVSDAIKARKSRKHRSITPAQREMNLMPRTKR